MKVICIIVVLIQIGLCTQGQDQNKNWTDSTFRIFLSGKWLLEEIYMAEYIGNNNDLYPKDSSFQFRDSVYFVNNSFYYDANSKRSAIGYLRYKNDSVITYNRTITFSAEKNSDWFQLVRCNEKELVIERNTSQYVKPYDPDLEDAPFPRPDPIPGYWIYSKTIVRISKN